MYLLFILICNIVADLFLSSAAANAANHNSMAITPTPITDNSVFYVVSLQGVKGAHQSNVQSFSELKESWTERCGGANVTFKQCPGVLHPKRGYGVTMAFVRCIDIAIAESRENQMVMFLEDDARLAASGKKIGFCDRRRREWIWTHKPKDTFLLLYGGHKWVYPTRDNTYDGNMTSREHFILTSRSFGAFGLAVPHHNLPILRDGLNASLYSGSAVLNPDVLIYELANSTKPPQRIFRTNPLQVVHNAGYSNTWKLIRPELNSEQIFIKKTNAYSKHNSQV